MHFCVSFRNAMCLFPYMFQIISNTILTPYNVIISLYCALIMFFIFQYWGRAPSVCDVWYVICSRGIQKLGQWSGTLADSAIELSCRMWCLGVQAIEGNLSSEILALFEGNAPMIGGSDIKVYVANMEPTWGRQDPGGPYGGPMNLAIWGIPLT